LIGEESGECFPLGIAGGGEEFDGEGAAGFFAETGGGVFEPSGGVEDRGSLVGIVFEGWRGFAEPDLGLENAIMQTACTVEEFVDEKGAIGAEGESLANAMVLEDGGAEVPDDEETAFRGRGVREDSFLRAGKRSVGGQKRSIPPVAKAACVARAEAPAWRRMRPIRTWADGAASRMRVFSLRRVGRKGPVPGGKPGLVSVLWASSHVPGRMGSWVQAVMAAPWKRR
jgi:hypothetical protein